MLFRGWSINGVDLLPDEGYAVGTTDITLSALWEEGGEVTFDANGGYYEEKVFDEDAGEDKPVQLQVRTLVMKRGDSERRQPSP